MISKIMLVFAVTFVLAFSYIEADAAPEKTCTDYNFNSEIPAEFTGFVSPEPVQGFTVDGFDGNFLRNPTADSPQATTLTLNNLPPHTFVDIGFLLAIIDSWDGIDGGASPDIFNVSVDGVPIFSESFATASGTQTYVDPGGVTIAEIQQRGFGTEGPYNFDSSYNMGNDPTFQNIPHTSDTLTISWFASGSGWQGGGDESWAIDNLHVCTDAVSAPHKSHGTDNAWNTRPTFGVSHETNQQFVENGFSFNGQQFTITDNHHTPFAEQSIDVGTVNSFSATVYADKKLHVQEFLFGIPTVGESQLAELGVEVWYDKNSEIEDVKVVQKSDVIEADSVRASHEKVKCLSSDLEAKCDTTTVSMTFLEPLKDKVMAIKAIDFTKREQRTYLNKGFDISGESLNPMKSNTISSSVKNEGLIKVTQIAKYSPYWVASDGRTFEMNSYGSFTQINQKFERIQDLADPKTRIHSDFGKIITYEQKRALKVFDSSDLISELPKSFAYIFPESNERMNDEMKQEMHLQEEIAKGILDGMIKPTRHF